MYFRLRALYMRYTTRHADRLGGFALPRRRLRRLGQIEQICRVQGTTRIVGWTIAPALRLSWPDGEIDLAPRLQRPDVARRFGHPLETGFEIDVPEGSRPLTLTVPLGDGQEADLPVPHPSDPPTPAARRRLRRAFLRDLLRATPSGLRWLLTRDPAARTRVKHVLGLEAVSKARQIDRRFLEPRPQPRSRRSITVIVPVHDAFDLLAETLARVEAHTDVDWHMVLIDDASTDPRVRPFLRRWADDHPGQVTLLELDRNLGFIGAVNRGFELAEGRAGHVVILNSDAMVPEGWASRIIAPFDRDPKIASVTPMSNDAEIFSTPIICQAVPLSVGMADRIDAVAQTLSVPDRLPSAPTGVGFCMALNARWFGREPRFDPAFGRGYGEEVDWCQKTRRAGARHVCLPTLFVEHRGGQSFGRKTKEGLVLRANALLARRYRSYDTEVMAYIGRDPMLTPRLALAVAIAGEMSFDALPLYLAHSMGGGAHHALDAEIGARTGQGQYALVLRVGGPHRWQLEVHGPAGVVSGGTPDLEHVRKMLAPVPALRIVYSCGVGDPDPASLPDALLALARADRPDRVEARLHDYFMITPSYCLLGSDGAFRGPIAPDDPDPAHMTRRPDGQVVTLPAWQAAWRRVLDRCDEVTVFSDASQRLLLASYPGLQDKVAYRPHAMIARIPRIEAPPHGASAAGTVAVLGNLNRQKGAGVLVRLAEAIARRGGGPRLVLIGNIDAGFSLPPSVQIHGCYEQSDIPHLAERYGVTAWLVPSLWPETFSFVVHEALATGLPVFGFDLGAQGEALHRVFNGVPVPFDPDGDHVTAMLDAFDGRDTAKTVPAEAPVARLGEAAE